MITLRKNNANILHVTVHGKLDKADYDIFVPTVEEMIAEEGKIRVLFKMDAFKGWTAGALWEDIKFDAKHFRDIERLALVGDKAWEKAMSVFCKPFTTAKIRYFDKTDLSLAENWINE